MNRKFWFVLITVIGFSNYSDYQAQVAVVANKSLSVKSIDTNTLINIYTLQSNELNAQKIKLFFLTEDSPTSKLILDKIGKTTGELKKIWLKAKLTGNGNPPEFVSTEADMIQKIEMIPNSIGFVRLNTAPSDVKVLLKIE